MGGHPKNIIMLCCDAFGVLPPVAKLTKEQAMYYFIRWVLALGQSTCRGQWRGPWSNGSQMCRLPPGLFSWDPGDAKRS